MNKLDERQSVSGRLDLEEIQRIATQLWGGRGFIGFVAVFGLILSSLYLHVATFTYTTNMTLIPTQSQQQNLAGQLGGLAAIAGINLPSGANTVTPFSVYQETAQTRQVAADIIRVWPEVMPALFKDQWNPETKSWHAPQSIRYAVFDFLRPILGVPTYHWNSPGPAELQQFIVHSVGISQDKKKPMLTVALNATDPDFSKRFILTLHQATDRALRRMTLDRAKKYAAYLANQLTTTQPSAVRDVLTQSLSDQETLIMMGSSGTDFAAQPLGPPESSTRPTSPVPVIVLLAGVLLGFLVGSVIVVFAVPAIDKSEHFRKTKFGSSLAKLTKVGRSR